MIVDARTLSASGQLAGDVVIVGSGPAGLALALRLASTYRLGVVVIEAGGHRFDFEHQSSYFSHAGLSDPRHAPTALYRRRMLGGTSTVWGGRCIPMSEDDFAPRPDLGRGGWPIAFDDVARYYSEALAFLDAGRDEFTTGRAFPDDPAPMAPTRCDDLELDAVERFSLPSNVAHEHRHAIADQNNIRLLINAPCVGIVTSPDGTRATGVSVQVEGTARSFEVGARAVILAAGGLETPRLLLWSRRGRTVQAPRGLGNSSDSVGRYYMTHVSGQIGSVRFSAPRGSLRLGYQRSHDGVWCRRLIQLSQRVRRDKAIPNFVMRPSIPSIDDPRHGSPVLSAAFLVKRFIVAEYARRLSAPGMETKAPLRSASSLALAHASNIAVGLPSLMRFSASWMWKRVLARRKLPSLFLEGRDAAYPLSYDAEQMPARHNRVALGSELDPLGIPRLEVHWTIDPGFSQKMQQTYDALAAAFQSAGCGSITLSDDERAAFTDHCGAQGGHFIGTARMSGTPSEGVVDQNLEVWDTRNLYVAGSAVFPTSGFANPTLTIVALSLRLADHVGQRLAREADTAIQVPGRYQVA